MICAIERHTASTAHGPRAPKPPAGRPGPAPSNSTSSTWRSCPRTTATISTPPGPPTTSSWPSPTAAPTTPPTEQGNGPAGRSTAPGPRPLRPVCGSARPLRVTAHQTASCGADLISGGRAARRVCEGRKRTTHPYLDRRNQESGTRSHRRSRRRYPAPGSVPRATTSRMRTSVWSFAARKATLGRRRKSVATRAATCSSPARSGAAASGGGAGASVRQGEPRRCGRPPGGGLRAGRHQPRRAARPAAGAHAFPVHRPHPDEASTRARGSIRACIRSAVDLPQVGPVGRPVECGQVRMERKGVGYPRAMTYSTWHKRLAARDRALFDFAAARHWPAAEAVLPRLSRAANHGVLWFAAASALGGPARRAPGAPRCGASPHWRWPR